MTQTTSFRSVAELVVEDGACYRLGTLIAERFDARSILVVSDPGISAVGLLDTPIKALETAGYKVDLYTGVSPDPKAKEVIGAGKAARAIAADMIIGLGGGSAMDVAKVAAVLATGDYTLDSFYGVGAVDKPRASLVQIPTTAGTGSEVTNVSIITAEAAVKKGIVDPALYADLAILDAKLTLTLPRAHTAATVIDAMVHAIEAFTTKRLKNIHSDMLAIMALKQLGAGLPVVMSQSDDLEARRKLLIGANMAGQAFSNAPVGAVHALAYPLGGHFHVSHGLSNSLVLPHVLRFNAQKGGEGVAALYAEIAGELEFVNGNSADALFNWLDQMTELTGIERRLREVNVREADIELLARDAMLQERLLINNPVPVTESEAYDLYEAAW